MYMDDTPKFTDDDLSGFKFHEYTAKEQKMRKTAALEKVNHVAAVYLIFSLVSYGTLIASRHLGNSFGRNISLFTMTIFLIFALLKLKQRSPVAEDVDSTPTYIKVKVTTEPVDFKKIGCYMFNGIDYDTGYHSVLYAPYDTPGLKKNCIVKIPVFNHKS